MHATGKLYCLSLLIRNRCQQAKKMLWYFYLASTKKMSIRRQRRHVKSCKNFVDKYLHRRKHQS